MQPFWTIWIFSRTVFNVLQFKTIAFGNYLVNILPLLLPLEYFLIEKIFFQTRHYVGGILSWREQWMCINVEGVFGRVRKRMCLARSNQNNPGNNFLIESLLFASLSNTYCHSWEPCAISIVVAVKCVVIKQWLVLNTPSNIVENVVGWSCWKPLKRHTTT